MSRILKNKLSPLTRTQQKQINGGLMKCYSAPVGGIPYCPGGMVCINGICRNQEL
ncbi:hypothetical protein [Chryseobacterium shandongense]|uniref:hypothetical protein n=1 Tax=Chryseobacterium shandongense TaxID=1493872 RepID=UPI0013DE1093|nr:hypothetical protein [Chryseobacterium shandongense]